MPNWTTVESSNRLLAAVFAVYDLGLHSNLDKLATCFGEDATKKSIMHRLMKIKSDVEQMKSVLTSEAPKAIQAAKADDGNDTASKPNGKTTKSRASTGKSNGVVNGVVNGRVKKTPTRGGRKSAPPGISAAMMEMAVETEGEVGKLGGGYVTEKDDKEDNAIEIEDDASE